MWTDARTLVTHKAFVLLLFSSGINTGLYIAVATLLNNIVEHYHSVSVLHLQFIVKHSKLSNNSSIYVVDSYNSHIVKTRRTPTNKWALWAVCSQFAAFLAL